MCRLSCLFLLINFLVLIKYGNSLDNGLARTPPMGWMTWQRFRCLIDCSIYPNDCISESLIKRTADAMVRDGYKNAGYEYIVIDDCWSEKSREENGTLLPDKHRFPNGLKSVGDYIHSKGLKFGLYQDYGTKTCGGYPGIIGYEEIDARTFAEWGVDYVKLDGCYADEATMDQGYINFGRLLNETGRPMIYSCSWPTYQEESGIEPNFTLIKEHCNLWRNWDDIDDSWASVKSITNYFDRNEKRIQHHAGPGHWNDPDMIIVGNFGLSVAQSKAQMAVWAILAAPLLMSNDLDQMSAEFRSILLNRNVINVNQDSLGIQGSRVKTINDIEIWTRKITPHHHNQYSYAIAFVSLRADGIRYKIDVKLSEIGLTHTAGYIQHDMFGSEQSDVFTHTASAAPKVYPWTTIRVLVEPSGCEFFKFTLNSQEDNNVN